MARPLARDDAAISDWIILLALVIAVVVVLGAYYLVFVLGWMRILAEWGIRLSYPAALRAEMLSMLAKYVPGGIWTPAARVGAAAHQSATPTGAEKPSSKCGHIGIVHRNAPVSNADGSLNRGGQRRPGRLFTSGQRAV